MNSPKLNATRRSVRLTAHALAFVFFAGTPALRAETRFFTSITGTTLEAEIADAATTSVTLKKVADNTTIVIPIATLCGEDKKYIAEWLKSAAPVALPVASTPTRSAAMTPQPAPTERPVVAPSTGKYSLIANIGTKKSDRSTTNYSDSRDVKLVLTVAIESREVTRDLVGAKAMLITLARSVEDTSDFKVIAREEFSVAVPAQKKFAQDTKEVRLQYDDKNTYRYGWKYYGHILVLKDSSGGIILVESSPEGMTKNVEAAQKLTEGQIVDRQLAVKSASKVVR